MLRVVAAALVMALWAGHGTAQARFGGWLEYQAIGYGESPGDLSVLGRNQLRLQPELEAGLGSRGRLFTALELRADAADAARNRLYLDEAYADLWLGPVDLRLGRQIFAWGRADALNPTDYFGAWDFTDVLDSHEEKLAQAGVRATWYVGRWSVMGAFVPRFTGSLLPGPGSRWWPNQATVGLGPGVRPVLEDARKPPGGAWGLRASGTAGGFDLALSGYRGPWHLPVLRAGSVRSDSIRREAVVGLEPRHYRVGALGADLATTAGPVGFHAEGAAYMTADRDGTDPDVEDPFLRYVLGADYTVRGAVLGRDVLVLLEWLHDVRLTTGGSRWPAEDLNHVFRRALFLRASAPLGDFSTLEVEGLYDVARRGWVVRIEPSWTPRDGLDLRLGIDLPGGSPGSFFGGYRDNRRVHARALWAF